MNIKEFLNYAAEKLKRANIDAPVLEAGVMLCHVLNRDRAYLYSHDDKELDKKELGILNNMLEQRMEHFPLQYLTGKTEFMSLTFMVSQAVLIPRQDTELLAEKCIELVKQKQAAEISASSPGTKKIELLDMCTGSGCIAVSIAHYCPDCRVTACDISTEAIAVAEVNKKLNGIGHQMELVCGNLFESLGRDRSFDIIASNPPYIETDTISGLQKEVMDYEPLLALDGGEDGLDFYRNIIDKAWQFLNPNGFLLFEIGYNQGDRVKELMKQRFSNINIYKDLGGNDRVVAGKLSIIPEP